MPKDPKLIDAHTHIQFAAYKEDRDEVIKRSLDAGVWMVNVGTQIDTSQEAIKLAEKYSEGLYATVGLHPVHTDKSFHDKAELGEEGSEFTSRGELFNYEEYKKLAEHPKVVAIGECGLDYYRLETDSKQKQADIFIKQIELAHEVKKPLMIHCRSAFSDLISILKNNKNKLQNIPGIIHFFSGTEDEAKELLDMGFYFTFGGVITFVRDYDKILKIIPIEKILLETDAPYVTPAPFRGQRNEPLFVEEVAKRMAQIKEVSLEEAQKQFVANTRSVLKI